MKIKKIVVFLVLICFTLNALPVFATTDDAETLKKELEAVKKRIELTKSSIVQKNTAKKEVSKMWKP